MADGSLPVLNIGPSANYVQAQKDFRAAQVNANKVLEDMLGQQQQVTAELKRQELAAGEADAAAKMADQAQAQERANAAREVQARMGGNMRDPSSLASELAVRIREESAIAREQLDTIRQRSSTSVLDNPLEFLLNAIELPQVAADYNARATKIDAMNSELGRIEARSKEQTQLAHAVIPTISIEQADAAAKRATADAAKRASAHDLTLISARVSYSQQAMSNIHAAMVSEQGMSSQQQQAAIANFNSRVDAIKFAESATRREAETALAMERLTDLKARKRAIAVAAAAYGHDPEKFTMSMFERLPAKEQFRFMSGAFSGSYGANPYDAWKNVNTFAGPNLPNTTKEWQRQIGALVQEITSSIKPNTLDFVEYEKDKDLFISRRLADRISKLSSVPVTESMSFLKELPPSVMAQTFANFERTVAGTVLGPLLTMETAPSTATVVDTIAKGLAAKGVPTTGQAYAISQYYIQNMQERNRNSNADGYRIQLPKTYPVMLDTGGRASSVDLTKPEQVQLYLLRKTQAGGLDQMFRAARENAQRTAEQTPKPAVSSPFRYNIPPTHPPGQQ